MAFDEFTDDEIELSDQPVMGLGSAEAEVAKAQDTAEEVVAPDADLAAIAAEEIDAGDGAKEADEAAEVASAEGGQVAAASAIPTSFGTVTERLSAIADEIGDSTMPLDDALDLLEEAVSLGMQASNLLESDMEARNAEDEQDESLDEGGAEEPGDEGSGSDS